MANYDLTPVEVPRVETKYRTIRTKIPVPESLPIFEALAASEPQSMIRPAAGRLAPGRGFHGRRTGGATAGSTGRAASLSPTPATAARRSRDALKGIIDQGLLASYVFVHEQRAELCGMLQDAVAGSGELQRLPALAPAARRRRTASSSPRPTPWRNTARRKKYFVSFQNAFHGRTMGAQLAGGMDRQKKWMVRPRPDLRPGPVPGRLQERGHVVSTCSCPPWQEKGIAPGGDRRGHDRELPGRRAGFPAGRVRAATGGVLPRRTTSSPSSTRSSPASAGPARCSATSTTASSPT